MRFFVSRNIGSSSGLRRASMGGLAWICMLWACGSAETGWKLPPETVRLKPGPGVEVAAGNCLLCHSCDYIATQPPMDRVAWTASVQKMREKYGAPVATNQVETLVNYLVKTYGKERPR